MAKGKKTGGRSAGTPNRVSASVRSAIAGLLDDYYSSEKFKQDIYDLEAKDRVYALARLTEYIAPKLQATTLDVTNEAVKTIEDRLIELSSGDG